jgi:hypothetical protein
MTIYTQSLRFAVWTCLGVLALAASLAGAIVQGAESKIPVTFSGGHETDPKDGGRPVVLVAAALDVKPEVFRQAFSSVRPAKNGKPSAEEARSNKAALMRVLQPYGVTNERLDEVSNYYRYQPQRGDLWTNTPAKAYAVVEDGQIKQIVVSDAGSGYSTPPKATVQGLETIPLKATVQFAKDLKKNGAVSSVEVASNNSAKSKP